MRTRTDAGSWIVAAVTLGLFTAALFVKGLVHDLFLEAGVFLVSVKIILLSHRNGRAVELLSAKLDAIAALLARESGGPGGGAGGRPATGG
ncbi:MAG: hypothetical protein MUC63_05385 [Planctomycetes bacterium]|nr:hypothetical protein [Planctomycetota bacterium]